MRYRKTGHSYKECKSAKDTGKKVDKGKGKEKASAGKKVAAVAGPSEVLSLERYGRILTDDEFELDFEVEEDKYCDWQCEGSELSDLESSLELKISVIWNSTSVGNLKEV